MKNKIIAYKVLNKNLQSPFKGFQYNLGEELTCNNFDNNPENTCSNGFYAGDIESILYANLSNEKIVVECEMSGKKVECGKFKTRWEKQKILRVVPIEEVETLVIDKMSKLNYDLYHALFPFKPLIGTPTEFNMNIHLPLLKKWDSVWGSVGHSVRHSVWHSVGRSVGRSVRHSVWGSVWDSVWGSVRCSVRCSVRHSVWGSVRCSVWAYMSHLFPNIKKWKYINHEEGVNPFQPVIDLWHMGIIPSFDGNTWRLHSGKNAEIIFKITKMELRK